MCISEAAEGGSQRHMVLRCHSHFEADLPRGIGAWKIRAVPGHPLLAAGIRLRGPCMRAGK